MVNAVIFDMDGLMLDTEVLYEQAWIEYGQKNNYNIQKSAVAKMRGQNAEQIKMLTKQMFGEAFCFEEAKNYCYNYIVKCMKSKRIAVKPGLEKLLEFLKNNNYKIALATSTEKAMAVNLLKSVNVLQYFDAMAFGNMVKNSKPAPDIFIMAANFLNTDVSQCLVLEDSPVGVLAAYRAKCQVIMVPDMDIPTQEIKKMTNKIFKTLDEVIFYLKNENK